MKAPLLVLFLATASSGAAEDYSYWIEPCEVRACKADDTELARWALEAWQRESKGAVNFRPSATEEHARIRLKWVGGQSGLYGETQPLQVDGKTGAVVYVLPAVANGADPVMRDAVVYLTCVHESGHALGLKHTAEFADIMYSFQYGGDIEAYFQRYRILLKARADIPLHSGISDADRAAIRGLK